MFSSLLLKYFPVQRFEIQEKSMEPNFKEKDEVLIVHYYFFKPKVEDVIVFSLQSTPSILIKRITVVNDEGIWVEGDNKSKSSDSRKFGFINKKNIIGKVIFKL